MRGQFDPTSRCAVPLPAIFRPSLAIRRCAPWLLALGWLWFVLINHLRVEWTINPQYGYGWAVPFLAVYLVGRRLQKSPDGGQLPEVETPASGRRLTAVALGFLALLYAPTRLVQVANPEWRLVSWALALEVIGITLCVLRLALDAIHNSQSTTSEPARPPARLPRFTALVFPICFLLVAVPWPKPQETALIQGLTRADAAITCELMGWLGIPAIPHGNVIEVATGEVGIDEACSGIRSFQATLMISLFVGELYQLSTLRRVSLCLGGFAMSFGFNLARMSVLVWVAARQGTDAIARWHDPTGVTILLACFFGLWGMGAVMGKSGGRRSEVGGRRSEVSGQLSGIRPSSRVSFSAFQLSAWVLCLWLFAVETSVAAWYGWHAARLPAAVTWSVAWPTNNPTCQLLPLPEITREILRCDEGRRAAWSENGLDWQAIFLRWNPGSAALHLAQNHTPEVCLTAAGHKLNSIAELQWLDVRGLSLPFRVYEVMDTPQPLFVFYCLWDDRAQARDFDTKSLGYGSRLAPVLAGRRNPGQRSLEIVVGGVADAAAAQTAVRAELEKILITPASVK